MWILNLLLFFIAMGLFQKYYNSKNEKKRLGDKVLDDNLEAADEYEIAFLKGGDRLAYELAFYHLLKSGYFVKEVVGEKLSSPSHLYVADSSKDISKLKLIEQEVLSKFKTTDAWPSVLLNLYQKPNSLDVCREKAYKLNLLYKKGLIFTMVRNLFNITITISSFLAVLTLSWLIQKNWAVDLDLFVILLVILTDIIIYRIVNRLILDKPVFLINKFLFKRIPQYTIREYYLTKEGQRYIDRFEKIKFPLPNPRSDSVFKEAYQVHRCSI